MPWSAGVIEIVGGLMLIGLQLRLAAFARSGTMAAACWTAHAPRSVVPLNIGGDAVILSRPVFLHLAVAGGGAWRLDNARRGLRRADRATPSQPFLRL